jgi:hypothetical protein
MSEWWTYRPSDFLLFSARTYWRLFELHNLHWWPLHLLTTALALAALAWCWHRRSARPLLCVCALAWGFVAWAFHLQRYAGINWAAGWLASAFAAQSLLLLVLATGAAPVRDGLPLRAGLALLFAALLLYPFAGTVFGRPLAQAEVFGLVPDPTVLATMGALLLASPAARRLPWTLAWVVPWLWCLCSGMTLWVMHAR